MFWGNFWEGTFENLKKSGGLRKWANKENLNGLGLNIEPKF